MSITTDRLDGLSSSVAIKGPVRVASTANLALTGTQTIDGVAVVTGDRVLVKDQATPSQNGIYVVDTGPWRRAADFARTSDVVKGTRLYVTDGTVNANRVFSVTTSNPISIGTSSVVFTSQGATEVQVALNATSKNPPVDADRVFGSDSAASFGLVYSTWLQVKAFLKTYFDTVYQALDADLTAIAALTTATFGRSLLTLADAATALTTIGAQAADAQLFSNIPQNSKSAAYTLVLTDGSKHIVHPSADVTARIWTIPANSSVAFPIGTTVTFVNQNGAGVITIAITTDTMRLAGAGTTGSRALAANGIATALKVTATEWLISGTGLT